MGNIAKLSVVLFLITSLNLKAGNEIDLSPAPVTDSASAERHGLFNGLQEGGSYGQGSYPEPFLVDDSDLEMNEFRLDGLHSAVGSSHSDNLLVELEKGFGLLTLEVEVPIERDVVGGRSSTNFDNIDVGARFPFYQYVPKKGGWDTTFGLAAEVGIPTRSAISKNTEVVPKIFNDSTIGHFTLQTILGYSTFIGASGDNGGQQTFEYGFVFGYTITKEQLSIPNVLQLILVSELSGEKGTDKDTSNSVIGDAGFRVNLKPIGSIQPRLGIVGVFPLSSARREDLHWGALTSLVFEF